MRKVAWCAAAALLACATTQSRFVPRGKTYAAIPDTQDVEVFVSGEPGRPFERVSRLDVHLEKTHFMKGSLEEAMPELKRQARLSGAEAIVEIRELRSGVGETNIYHVTATGIRYTEPASK